MPDAGWNASTTFAGIRGVIFDLDGVLLLGRRALPGAAELMSYLEERDVRTVALTNNSRRSPEEVDRVLSDAGIRFEADRVITSSWATAQYLSMTTPAARLYVLGSSVLKEEIGRVGLSMVDDDPDTVVVGYYDEFDHVDLTRASRFLLGGADFVGTNPDSLLPTDDGPIPECGALLAFLESTTGKKPYIVGKPNGVIIRLALQRLGLAAHEVLVVGDTVETDVAAGRAAGCSTALVLTGNATAAESNLADATVDDLESLLRLIRGSLPQTIKLQ